MTTLDIQAIRYINLLDNTARVRTRKCFVYNNNVIFAVPGSLVSKAIGQDARNVRFIQEKLGRRVRVIKESLGPEDAERFVREIVAPVGFKSLDIKEGMLVLNAGAQSKAALIGRNKRRYEELRRILYDTYSMDLKIV